MMSKPCLLRSWETRLPNRPHFENDSTRKGLKKALLIHTRFGDKHLICQPNSTCHGCFVRNPDQHSDCIKTVVFTLNMISTAKIAHPTLVTVVDWNYHEAFFLRTYSYRFICINESPFCAFDRILWCPSEYDVIFGANVPQSAAFLHSNQHVRQITSWISNFVAAKM